MPVLNYRISPDLIERIWLYIPDKTRNAFATSEAMYRLVYGPPASGKTELLLWELQTLLREYPGMEQCIWRKLRVDAVTTVGKDMIKYFGEFGDYDKRLDEFNWRFEDEDDPSMIYTGKTLFRGFDEKATRTRYGSFNIHYFWLAEAHELTEKDFATACERVRTPGAVRIGGQLDAVSEEIPEGHWLEKWFIEPSRSEALQRNYEAYELKFTDMKDIYARLGRSDYYQSRLDSVAGDDMLYQLKIAGKRPAAALEGDAMYPTYRPTQADGRPWHFFPHAISASPGVVQIGMDLGMNHTYMAAVWWQFQLASRVVILRSLVTQNSSVEQFAREVAHINADAFPGNEFVVRTDRMILEKEKVTNIEWSAQQMLGRHGIHALPGEQAEHKRRQAVNDLLERSIDGGPALIVSGNAREFHRAMAGGFCRDRSDRGVYGKSLKNAHSHVAEAFEHSYAASRAWMERKPASLRGPLKHVKVPTYAG